jgi:hypothetical protein
MSVDIVEIALDNMTGHQQFEKLASEVMRDEGYPNIKPLGGVADAGKDAVQESYFFQSRVNQGFPRFSFVRVRRSMHSAAVICFR